MEFSPQFDGRELYLLHFRFATSPATDLQSTPSDVLPPNMFREGDVIDVDGNQFLIVDDSNHKYVNTSADVRYLDIARNRSFYKDRVVCIWLNESGQVSPQGNKPYKIQRQPINSANAPYQLPAGIVIDMQASVAEGSDSALLTYPRFPTLSSLYTNRSDISPGNLVPSDTIGIMFSPTGAVDSVFFNGNELPSVSRLVMMLGRIENGGIDPAAVNNTSNPKNDAPWTLQTGEKIEDVQKRINWLSPDSRLLSIVASSGRTVVSEAAFVPAPFYTTESGDNDYDTAEEQIEAAHEFAHEMTTAK